MLLAPSPLIASAAKTSDIMVRTKEHGHPVTDACYVLVDFSNVGCDDNMDGGVTFLDVPIGTYTLRQTADLGPGRHVDDSTIVVTGASHDRWEYFDTHVVSDAGNVTEGAIDISLITRDPKTGGLLTGTCYELRDYSNIGCDENGDGQVEFADIPFGTYTVHQTKAPDGYPTINDYAIVVEPTDIPTGFVVKQAPEQNAPNTRNVSVVLVDSSTNTKLVSDACVQIVNASNVGCDEDLRDGQIDFLDVPAGDHEIVFTRLPTGYVVATGPDDGRLHIDPERSPANVTVYIALQPAP